MKTLILALLLCLAPVSAHAALQTYAGTFTITSGTGNQTISGIVDKDGASFTPIVVIAWGDRETSDPGFTDNLSGCFGVATNRATDQQSVICAYTDDDAGTTDSLHAKSTDTFIRNISGTGPNYNVIATINGFGSGEFTINKTTNDGTSLNIYKFLAIGGSDLEDAYIAELDLTNTTGSKTLTSVPFQGNLALFFGVRLTAAGNASGGSVSWSIGAATDSTHENVVSTYTRNATTSANLSKSYINSGASIAYMGTATDNVVLLADFSAWTSDGLTVNVSQNSDGVARQTFVLIMKGTFQADIQQKARPTSATTQAVTTNFNPVGGMIFGTYATANATAIVQNHLSIGAFDRTRNQGKWYGDEATINSDTSTYSTASNVYTQATIPSTVAAQAAVSAFSATDYTMNFTTADATARLYFSLALGSAASASRRPVPSILLQ